MLLFPMAEKVLGPEFPFTDLFEYTNEPQSRPVLEIHAHDMLEVGYCHAGSGILITDDTVTPFSSGSICVVSENVMHVSRSATNHPSPWTYFWVDVPRLLVETPGGLDLGGRADFSGDRCPRILSPKANKALCNLMRDIIGEFKARQKGYLFVVRSLICAFLGMLDRACHEPESAKQTQRRPGLMRLAPALQYITHHYAELIEVDDLAKACSTSGRTIRRMFQEAMGRSPLQYLAQLRVRMAAGLLVETQKPISLIAYEVGFESINVFNRQFRSAFGMTPKVWRAKHGPTAS